MKTTRKEANELISKLKEQISNFEAKVFAAKDDEINISAIMITADEAECKVSASIAGEAGELSKNLAIAFEGSNGADILTASIHWAVEQLMNDVDEIKKSLATKVKIEPSEEK